MFPERVFGRSGRLEQALSTGAMCSNSTYRFGFDAQIWQYMGHAALAQLVEQLSCKQQVKGSSPLSGSTECEKSVFNPASCDAIQPQNYFLEAAAR